MIGRRILRALALLALAFVSTFGIALARGPVHVKGYFRGGKYVAPHYRSAPNHSFSDNWSTKGNTNPFTGKAGTRVTPPRGYGGYGGSGVGGGYSSSAAASGGDVYVKGHYTSNGAYVQPHFRSHPDGNFDNNWSTVGNTNPHTGEPGTKTSPSGGTAGRALVGIGSAPAAADFDALPSQAFDDIPEPPTGKGPRFLMDPESRKRRGNEHRQDLAAKLSDKGVTLDWSSHTAFELANAGYRASVAEELQEAGEDVTWDSMTASELYELKLRMKLGKRIASRGYQVDWHIYSLAELLDIDDRITLVRYLRNHGQVVNWKKHSRESLQRMVDEL